MPTGLPDHTPAAMLLEDVDWRTGEILVRGKGGRRDRLPLPTHVGEALAGYLRRRLPHRTSATRN